MDTNGYASLLDTACSSVTGFINGALDTIFGALRIDPSSLGTSVPAKVLRFLANLWNTAVSLARQVVDAAITQLTAPSWRPRRPEVVAPNQSLH